MPDGMVFWAEAAASPQCFPYVVSWEPQPLHSSVINNYAPVPLALGDQLPPPPPTQLPTNPDYTGSLSSQPVAKPCNTLSSGVDSGGFFCVFPLLPISL